LLTLLHITSTRSEDLLQTVYILSDILNHVTLDNCIQQIVQVEF